MNAPLQTVEANNIASQELVTLDPKTYVAAVYEPFSNRLQAAIKSSSKVTYAIATKEGMATAKECRALFRTIRLDCDKERAARKAPIIAIGKLLESAYTEIETAVKAHEEKFDADIKAEEQRLEDEKAAKLKAEEEAKAAIQNKIDAIKNKPLEVMNKTVADIEAAIAELSPLIPTPAEYGERFIEAEYALKGALETLNNILAGKKAQELIEAQNKAAAEKAEAENKEAQRVDGIKAKIQNIKNYIIKASDCDFSGEVASLAEELELISITEKGYQEFTEEALAAASKSMQFLLKQKKIMANEEREEAEAKAQAADKARQELEAQIIAEAKNDDGAVVDATFNESDFNNVFEVKEQPAVQVGSVRPTAQAIIALVATTYKVDTATANRWLAQSFGELKAA